MNKRKLILSALTAAKPFVAEFSYPYGEKYQFICHAIQRATLERLCSLEAGELAEEMILERLNGVITVECWLGRNVPGYRDYNHHPHAVQQYRHRWLNALIEEFSK